MHQFKVYKHPVRGYEAVKIGFSWPAFFFGLFWTLAKRLWGCALAWFAALLVLAIVDVLLGMAIARMGASESVLVAVLVLFLSFGVLSLYLVSGFKGNQWREANLEKRGYDYLGSMHAETPDAAIAQEIRHHEKHQTESTVTRSRSLSTELALDPSRPLV